MKLRRGTTRITSFCEPNKKLGGKKKKTCIEKRGLSESGAGDLEAV